MNEQEAERADPSEKPRYFIHKDEKETELTEEQKENAKTRSYHGNTMCIGGICNMYHNGWFRLTEGSGYAYCPIGRGSTATCSCGVLYRVNGCES